MKSLFLSLALAFALFASISAPALAGGDPDQLGANLYDNNGMPIQNAAVMNGYVGATSSMEAANVSNASSTNQMASANQASTILQIALVVLIVGGAAGLIYFASKRNKVV
ncbi:MAG: hypothetical protein V4438_00805 [Patescibacteria group bacterium]